MIRGHKYSSVVIGAAFVAILLFHGRLGDYDEERYHEPPPEEILKLNKVRFKEVSKEYGVDGLVYHPYFPNPEKNEVINKFMKLFAVPPNVSVFDLNQDGWMDFYYSESDPAISSRLFLNDGGKRFVEVTEDYPFLKQKGELGDNLGIWADFTGDGMLDFLSIRAGCHTLFIQKEPMVFEERKDALDVCSLPFSVNFLDFNLDGALDVALGNFFSMDAVGNPKSVYVSLMGKAGISSVGRGDKNILLLNDGTGKFFKHVGFGSLENEPGAHTQGVGVSYINEDPWPDLFFSNDYYSDAMYLNHQGQYLGDVTNQYVPKRFHGWSGMNSEFADYDMDGRMDLYVTNAWGPPSARSENLLWRKKEDGSGFENKSVELDIYKCGWAWGAKFSDFDLDGDLDLFVSNGRAMGAKAKSYETARSFNHLRGQARIFPGFLVDLILEHEKEVFPAFNDSNYQFYGFERNCMFIQHEGHFYDVAEQAGVADLENGRSIAKIDIDNDGKQDVLLANLDGPLLMYKNISETTGNWVGLNALQANGLVYHGAVVHAIRSDNKPLIDELFVMNGYRGQNDPRIHFGLGEHGLKNNEVIVVWPGQKIERFTDIKLNQYNEIIYGQGLPLTH